MAAELAVEKTNRPTPEFHLYGGVGVLQAMLKKQDLLRQGRLEEAAQIRIGVLCEGGGHAVANEVGAITTLFERGMFDGVVDVVVGASGGGIVATYGVLGDRRGHQLFKNNCDNG